MGEQWREIPNTDYSVSDQGRVASRKFGKWRFLKPSERQGYLRVHFTAMDVREIRRRCATGEPQRIVAADYGIAQTNVSLIVRREHWAWVA